MGIIYIKRNSEIFTWDLFRVETWKLHCDFATVRRVLFNMISCIHSTPVKSKDQASLLIARAAAAIRSCANALKDSSAALWTMRTCTSAYVYLVALYCHWFCHYSRSDRVKRNNVRRGINVPVMQIVCQATRGIFVFEIQKTWTRRWWSTFGRKRICRLNNYSS